MAELLVKAVNATHSDPDKDRHGCYKRGMPVVVMPDGHSWGAQEGLPKFVVIKIPGVSVERVRKYIEHQLEDTPDENGNYPIYMRRLWKIRWADLPLAARNKLASDGELTIKAGTYAGDYDYTWVKVRQYFRNLKTGLDETGDL